MTSVMPLAILVGGLIRHLLYGFELHQIIAERVEVSTPLNSWKRVTEGVYLYQHGICPYSGELFHETPLALFVFNILISHCSSWLPAFFILCDLFTAYVLYHLALKFISQLQTQESKKRDQYASDSTSLHLKPEDREYIPSCVAIAYLSNPYAILNCVGQTTTVFANMLLALTLLFMVKGHRVLTCLALSLATVQSIYPVTLIIPASLSIAMSETGSSDQYATGWKRSTIKTVLMFLTFLGGWLVLCAQIIGGWHFLDATYGFIILVPDLSPNVGLFWYFFTEMFEHFRALFVCAFQINAFLHAGPLALRFRKEPMLLAFSICALNAIFKSYPSVGDVSLYLALLPLWKHLFPLMQQSFVVGCFFLITSVLAPILWHLWIYAGSANANFYFGVTLAFGTAQIFLVTDVLFAHIKREFYLIHGMKKEIDKKPASLVLAW